MTTQSPTRGHTQNYLRQLLAEHGLAPRSSLGQCFLTDLNLLDVLVGAAELSRDDFVLEVGTGTGSLTGRLAAAAGSVLTVEIDPGLASLARESVGRLPNVQLLECDILARKNALNPAVLSAIDSLAPDIPGSRRLRHKLVANLPYVVATPVISLFLLDNRPWERFVVTIQKELADRLLAAPSTPDYGSISVITQALADVKLLRELPPSVFWPKPKVWSAFVSITPRAAKRAAIEHLPTLSAFARGVMLHRRKVLRAAMSNWLTKVPKPEIDRFLASQSIAPQVRAESLPPEEFVRLANALPAEWLR
jgi:16S rRNA (adenine1518-N6/adenine1519-N6)-dimethyltransferase